MSGQRREMPEKEKASYGEVPYSGKEFSQKVGWST